MARLPATMSPIRCGWTSMSLERRERVMPIGSMKSCSRISPGWMGGSRLAMEVSSVVVDDLDIGGLRALPAKRSEEHTSELQSLMRTSYAVFCLKKKQKSTYYNKLTTHTRHA